MPSHRLPAMCLRLSAFLAISMTIVAPAQAHPAPLWLFDTGLLGLIAPPLATPQPIPPEQLPAQAEAPGFSPIRVLIDFANGLRDIRYKRGGRSPATGFDCSGFVRYVFQQGLGADLPNTSAAQYHSGQTVSRDDLRSGDLVFFRTRGKRVSHVGIYVGDGKFIHAPSAGKTVSVSSLAEHYWSRRFAGARRPDILAGLGNGKLHGSS
jgi:cell wall-associated NlpC family hydrolase